MGSHVNENEKSLLKFKNFEKWSGDMMDLSTKIGINWLDGFWENAFYGRTTTDNERPRHSISSADIVKQS